MRFFSARILTLPVLFSAVALTAAAGPAPAVNGSKLSYSSPSCGPNGGSTGWACGAWPSTTPPNIGGAGTITKDPDTGNRVMRLTQSGAFGEDPGTAFKAFDAGWKQAWNANDTRIIATPWTTGAPHADAYWVGFNPANMSLTGQSAPIPNALQDAQWDQYNPDLLVGVSNGVAKTFNVATRAWSTVFDPASTGWGAGTWIASWGGNTVCIAEGPQDNGYRVACHDRKSNSSQVIDLHSQTINGNHFTINFLNWQIGLPSGVGVHTIMMGPDGNWLAIDTHGNTPCSVPGLDNYASTSLFINLRTNTGYEWNTSCGKTHWAYGYNAVMTQSTSPKWSPNGTNGCNSDSRGIARRNTDASGEASFAITQPCSFFDPSTQNVNVHLSWLNNLGDVNANRYPVIMATQNEGVANSFLWADIAAMQTTAAPNKGKLWRFAQTWNDQTSDQCGFLEYSSPAVSRDGKFAIYPSDWRGQTGSNGVCNNGKRTDLFVFELK